ncbi:MAG: hypothetical protein AMXMBFR58_06960 [Phycisphaerae bacterium]
MAIATVLTAASLVGGPVSTARADEFLDRVNNQFASVPQAKRSDLVILPLLAKLDPAPRAVHEADDILLIAPDQAAWPDVVKWLDGENQKAVVDALFKVTEAADFKDSMVFAQPYGADGVSPELIQAGMYTELGDPPLLAAMNIQYLPAIKTMERLAQLEAVRRAHGGDVLGGLEVLARLSFFGRQLVERPMFRETLIGYTMMWRAMERMRDIAYSDYRGSKGLQAAAQLSKLPDLVNRLEEDRGVFAFDRIPFPTGNQAAAEQVVSRVMTPSGTVNKETFATTLARIRSSGRPLRLFGEAGRWDSVASVHRDAYATNEELRKVFGDWQSRWRLDPFDPRMLQPFYWENLDRSAYPILGAAAPVMSDLFPFRQYVRTQIAGTRHSLAVLAFYYKNRGWPPVLSSVRPDFIKALTADPFNPNRARGQQPPLAYFVPVRDSAAAGPRDERRPHEMVVFVPGGVNFRITLREDTFVLYSTGPDGGMNRAERIQDTWQVVKDSDLLLWPPISSLWRQHLRDAGTLK